VGSFFFLTESFSPLSMPPPFFSVLPCFLDPVHRVVPIPRVFLPSWPLPRKRPKNFLFPPLEFNVVSPPSPPQAPLAPRLPFGFLSSFCSSKRFAALFLLSVQRLPFQLFFSAKGSLPSLFFFSYPVETGRKTSLFPGAEEYFSLADPFRDNGIQEKVFFFAPYPPSFGVINALFINVP